MQWQLQFVFTCFIEALQAACSHNLPCSIYNTWLGPWVKG